MSCEHDCDRPARFPALIHNRPGLARIGYRLGDYASFREHLLDRLDQSARLQAWTHREADDPGIALLEGGAIVAEILAFYQELYANEVFLRSADWRESISRLVQLTGYRLAPGVGGEATFALIVDDPLNNGQPVSVPMGFGIKVQLEDLDQASIFETITEHTAYPAQNEFRLYRPRKPAGIIGKGLTELELTAVGGKHDLSSRQALELKKGDRLMLIPDTGKFDAGGGSWSSSYVQPAAEILIVKETETVLDRIIVRFEGELQLARGTQVRAYVIDRSFRHFGHNAPSRFGGDIDELTGIQDLRSTNYARKIDAAHSGERDYYATIGATEMLLEGEIDDLPLGSTLICQGRFTGAASAAGTRSRSGGTAREAYAPYSGGGSVMPKSAPAEWGSIEMAMTESLPSELVFYESPASVHAAKGYYEIGVIDQSTEVAVVLIDISRPFTVVRRVESVQLDTEVWAAMSGSCTAVGLGQRLIANTQVDAETADLRSLVFHEAVSPELTFAAPSDWHSGAFSNTLLHYFGKYRDARELFDRELMLQHEDGRLQTVRVTAQVGAAELTGRDPIDDWLWPITLSDPPSFPRGDFDELQPKVTVYGNLVHTDQGETQPQVVLGSGDARQSFQTFAIPKTPLTYLLDETRTPAQAPELLVYVDALQWQQVEVLYGRGPKERVYVVRQDEEGASYVQFGDGKSGARLPTGQNNVVALYRKGTGARGAADGKPSATGKLKQLKQVRMPGPAVGGADAETADNAREAAPLRMQSLGRMVGLADYEAEALGLPGVRKAKAEWLAPNGAPLIRLTVLTEGGEPAEAVKVQQSMSTFNRCRGAARFVVKVRQALRQYVYLDLSVGYRSDRRESDIEATLLAALGVTGTEGQGIDPDDGLFGETARRLGQGVHVSQVLAVAQQVEGVAWARVDGFQWLDLGVTLEQDPGELAPPITPNNEEALGCPGDRLLALYVDHLVLNLSREAVAQECES